MSARIPGRDLLANRHHIQTNDQHISERGSGLAGPSAKWPDNESNNMLHAGWRKIELSDFTTPFSVTLV